MRVLLVLLSLATWGSLAHSEPLWRIGAAVGGAHVPHYPGSEEFRRIYAPSPAVRYRGRFLRSEEDEGTRLRFLRDERFELDVTGDATLPGRAAARTGMQALPLIGGIGPRIGLRAKPLPGMLLHWAALYRFMFEAPGGLRLASLGGVYGLGPRVHIDIGAMVTLGFTYYRLWSDTPLQRAYYEVPQHDARVERPRYQARPGLFSDDILATLNVSHGHYTFFAGARLQDQARNPNRASPLLLREQTRTYFVAFTRWLLSSRAPAQH